MPIVDNRVLDHADATAFCPAETSDQEALRRRAKFLGDRDRMIIELVLRGGVSRGQLGRLVGNNRGTISRRVARLAGRLHDPLVVALTDEQCPLPQEYRQLGIEHFLRGMSVSELADLHRLTPHAVRRMITFLRGWHRGLSERS